MLDAPTKIARGIHRSIANLFAVHRKGAASQIEVVYAGSGVRGALHLFYSFSGDRHAQGDFWLFGGSAVCGNGLSGQ